MIVKRRLSARLGATFAAVALASVSVCPCVAFAESEAVPATQKTENVNITANANGEVEKVEVESTLKNEGQADQLLDYTSLADVKGKDDVTYETIGDNIVWNADGKNVTYTGITDQQLPISVYVTYRLDGLIVSPEEIAGKSGDVSIRYDFKNESWFSANVNGTYVDMRTPFTCITAIMLKGENFSNVSVTNGKVVDDGDDVVITGYAMPGLKASLGSMADNSDVPEYFEITAKAKDFNLKSSMTIVTAGLMSDLDVQGMGFDDLNEVSDGLGSGISDLIDGADELTDGLESLTDGAYEISDGACALSEGAETLSSGLYLLTYGEDGKSGLQGAARSSSDLIDALGEVGSSLDALADSDEGLPAAAAGLEKLASAYPDADTLAALEAAIGASNLDKKTAKAIVAILESTQQVSTISAGVSQASDGLEQLAEGYGELVEEAGALPEGLSQAASAAQQLYSGTVELSEGASQLSEGTSEFAEGMEAAAEGSGELAEGLVTYDNEGISKVVSTIDNDIGGFKKRLEILSNESTYYDSFSGKLPGTTSSVQFVFQTAAIESE